MMITEPVVMQSSSSLPMVLPTVPVVPDVTGVNDIEDLIDKLMLTLFETMRSDPSQNTVDGKSKEILFTYQQILLSLDHLIGIGKTKKDIDQDILAVSSEYEKCKQRIFEKETKLKEMSANITEKLLQVSFITWFFFNTLFSYSAFPGDVQREARIITNFVTLIIDFVSFLFIYLHLYITHYSTTNNIYSNSEKDYHLHFSRFCSLIISSFP
jgi:hypothetical protein